MRARSFLLLSFLALGPLLLVLWATGGNGEEEHPALAAEGLDARPAKLPDGSIRSGDGVLFSLPVPPTRIAPATAGVVDVVTHLVGPERVALLPQAAFSFSRLAVEPGAWESLPRFSGFQAESFLASDVDLVIAAGWQSPETVAALRRAGIPVLVLVLPARWDEVLEEVTLLADVLGTPDEGRSLLAKLEPRVRALAERPGPAPLAVSYTNLGTGGWVAGRGTTTDILFELVGLRNAATEAGLDGHREIDLEGLFALAPEVIVVGAENAEEGIVSTRAYLEAQPVLAELPALERGWIVSLPQELFTTASIELLRAAETLASELDRLREE